MGASAKGRHVSKIKGNPERFNENIFRLLGQLETSHRIAWPVIKRGMNRVEFRVGHRQLHRLMLAVIYGQTLRGDRTPESALKWLTKPRARRRAPALAKASA